MLVTPSIEYLAQQYEVTTNGIRAPTAGSQHRKKELCSEKHFGGVTNTFGGDARCLGELLQ